MKLNTPKPPDEEMCDLYGPHPDDVRLIKRIVVGFFVFAFVVLGIEELVEKPRQFRAWQKLSGNVNKLSYSDWRSLTRSQEKSSSATPVFIPISYR